MKWNKNLFTEGNNTILANDVECGMIISLTKNRYFYVDDMECFFINDDVSNIYNDGDEEIKPEHVILTFYNENEKEIYSIPGDAKVIAFERITGNCDSIV